MLRAFGRFFFKHRDQVSPAVLLALFALLPPGGPGGGDAWMDALGLLVCLSGQGLRAATIGLAYIKRGGRRKEIQADRLVTTGMFGACRNPLYLGNLLILTGLFAIHGNPLAAALGAGFYGLAYLAVVAEEEAWLAAHFGSDYVAYCARVPRWIPDLSLLPDACRGMAFDWRRVLAKDYGTAYSWVLAAILLLAYEDLRGGTPAPAGIIAAGVALAAATAALLLVRRAKKTGRLSAP
jgi:protein-S-isoprenylcysteine O-methyltransferase Ste14